jgi:hypothetical protein
MRGSAFSVLSAIAEIGRSKQSMQKRTAMYFIDIFILSSIWIEIVAGDHWNEKHKNYLNKGHRWTAKRR